jgi:hypothetical protein
MDNNDDRLTAEEKWELLKMVLQVPLIVGFLWLFIVLYWVAFG